MRSVIGYLIAGIGILILWSILTIQLPECRSDELMVRGYGLTPYVCVKGHY